MDCVKLLIQTKYNKICACKTIGNVKADQTVADFKELLFIFRCEHGLAVMLFKRDGWALAGGVQEATGPCFSCTLMFLSLSFSLPSLSKNK